MQAETATVRQPVTPKLGGLRPETTHDMEVIGRQFLHGLRTYNRGEIIPAMPAGKARESHALGVLKAVDPSSFNPPLAAPAQPVKETEAQPDASAGLDRPGDGRPYKCKVRKGRTVNPPGAWSYGDDKTLYLSEEDARVQLKAGKIDLLDPPGLPAHLEPAKEKLPHIGRLGCAEIGMGPLIAAARIDAQP